MNNETEIMTETTNNEEFVLDKTLKVGKWRIPVGHLASEEVKYDELVEVVEKENKIKKTMKKVLKVIVPIGAAAGAVVLGIFLLGSDSDDETETLIIEEDAPFEVDEVEVESVKK